MILPKAEQEGKQTQRSQYVTLSDPPKHRRNNTRHRIRSVISRWAKHPHCSDCSDLEGGKLFARHERRGARDSPRNAGNMDVLRYAEMELAA